MGRVFAFTDLHGRKDVFDKVIDFLNPDDTVYNLGDTCDRGPHGIVALAEMIADPRFINLMGNHDSFIIEAMPAIWGRGTLNSTGKLWVNGNGGAPTLNELLDYPIDDQKYIVEQISKFPTEVRYLNKNNQIIIMEHAGYTPFGIPHRSHDPLWDRDHFYDDWRGNTNQAKNTFLVHGHTPVQYLEFHYGYNGQDKSKRTAEEYKFKMAYEKGEDITWMPHIIRYCDNHKFDIDIGCVSSGITALLDLDTFDEYYISSEGLENIIKNER